MEIKLTAKNRTFLILKRVVIITITILLLFLIFRQIELGEVTKSLRNISPVVLFIILITAIIKTCFEIRNWQTYIIIMTRQKPSLAEVIRSHLIGRALQLGFPGGYGVVGKVLFVNNSKKKTLVSVGIEKFFQAWLIFFFAAIAGYFYFHNLALVIRIAALILVFTAPILVYYLKFAFKRRDIFFQNYITKIPEIGLIQILYMLITIFQYYLILNQIGHISFFNTFISVPLILFANTIPITYGGLGLREAFAITVLQRYAYEPSQAVTASLTIFIINTVLPSLVGAVLLLFHKDKSPA